MRSKILEINDKRRKRKRSKFLSKINRVTARIKKRAKMKKDSDENQMSTTAIL